MPGRCDYAKPTKNPSLSQVISLWRIVLPFLQWKVADPAVAVAVAAAAVFAA